MKTFKIIAAICLLLFLLGSLAVLIFTATFDNQRFKAQLTSQLSTRLGRVVHMDKLNLSFSLFRGVFLNVRGFHIMDDAQFSPDVLLGIADLKLDINLLVFLTQKKVVISHIAVSGPRLNLVRNEEGMFNIQALASSPTPSSEKKSGANAKPQPVSQPSPPPKKDTPNLPQLLVRAIRIEDGALTFTDHVQSQPLRVELKNMTLDVAGLSSTSPFKFIFECSMFSDERNLDIRGQGQLNLKNLQVRLDDVAVNFDISAIDTAALETAVPGIKSSEWGLTMQGRVETLISQMVVGSDGLLLLAGTGRAVVDALNLEKVPFLTKGAIEYEISEKDVQVRKIDLAVGGGSLAGQVRLDDYLKQQKYFLDLDLKDIDLARSIPEFGPQAQFQGVLSGHLKLNGHGFQPEKIFSDLAGEGQILIAPGTLENFNILRFILSQITVLPRLDDVLIKNLPEPARKEFEKRGTVFENIEIKTILVKENIVVEQADFVSSVFSLTAQGQMDPGRNISFSANLYVSKDLTLQMVAAVPELKVLSGEDGRLSIPLKSYSGTISGFRIFPDSEVLAKKILLDKGGEQFQRLLMQASPGNEPPGEKENKPPEQQQPVNNILDAIFKD